MAPTTLSWSCCVSTVVPLMTMAKSPLKESVLARTSTPDRVGLTAVGVAPGSSRSVPLLVLIWPPLMKMSLLLINCMAVAAVRLMSALTVMAPLLALPMMRVPVVTRSSSSSERPSGPPAGLAAEPRLMVAPAV